MALQIPDLDDRRYTDLTGDSLTRIPVLAPEWTDFNASDPGITLTELFAWLAEMQIYGLNYLRPEHYRKFLRLMGIRPRPATAATVAVSFSSASGWEGLVPAGTELSTEEDLVTGEMAIPFETAADLWVLDNRVERIISAWGTGFLDNTEANARMGIFYPAFGNEPVAGSALYVAFPQVLSDGREIRVTIDLYETDLPPVAHHRAEAEEVFPSVTLTWEYSTATGYQPLVLTEDTTRQLTRSGHILFTVPTAMAAVGSPYLPLTTPATLRPFIRCILTSGSYEIPPRLDSLRINTVPAVQRTRVTDEPVVSKGGVAEGNGMPGQVFLLAKAPVLKGSLALRAMMGFVWEEWQIREDFDASRPDDRHFTLDPETGEIRFGDGVHGRVLPEGAEVRADYLSGGGSVGNVKAGKITKVITAGLGDATVINDTDASGGREAEPLQEAMERTPLELRKVDRAITSDDFEYLAKTTPGLRVARAKAIPLWQPGTSQEATTAGVVTVVVVPWSFVPRPFPSSGFLRTVCHHLNRHRLVTTRLKVVPPEYVKVAVRTRLHAANGFSAEDVRKRVEARLLEYLHPLTGGDDGDGWLFGRPVYRSEVVAVIRRVEGVDCVLETILSGDSGVRPDGGGNLVIDNDALVWSDRHEVEVLAGAGRCRL